MSTMSYGRDELFKKCQRDLARRKRWRCAAWTALVVLLLGLIAVPTLMMLGGCASAAPATTSIRGGSAQSTLHSSEDRGSHLTITATPVPTTRQRCQSGAGVLRVRPAGERD